MNIGKAGNFILSRLAQGYYTFSLKEAERVLGDSENVRQSVYRLMRQGWLFSPGKGFYVIIDPQHQGTGFVPVEWFIDDWMRFTGARYYVGLLSAAMQHGASHQKPQQVQIISDMRPQLIEKGAYSISFFHKKAIPDDYLEQRQSPAGYYWISTPEMTAYDLLRYPKASRSLNLTATVMQELGEKIDPDRLAALIDAGSEVSVLQRLGWMLDQTGWEEKTSTLADKLRGSEPAWRTIHKDLTSEGPRDTKWHVIVNVDIEADL
ncbi:MAG: type IV toxin-antitoxin system AbiEi family antitoxin domain-containing protein [Armatimonadota bacterium]